MKLQCASAQIVCHGSTNYAPPVEVSIMRTQLRNLLASWKETPYSQFKASDVRSLTYDRLAPQLGAAADYTVASGPSRGLKFFSTKGFPMIDTTPTTKLLGSYEEEIHPWIESLATKNFEQIVHLGAGVGYHAVGLAMRFPAATTTVFDTLIASRQSCRMLGVQNGVRERISLRGFCGPDGLLEFDLSGALVFADCGGAELSLLDPRMFPTLRLATVLVETHDTFDSRISRLLRSRFGGTHQIEVVDARPRDIRNYPLLSDMPIDHALMAVDESRRTTKEGLRQNWFLMTPYSS
jgi:hypothetical protein